MLFFKRYIFIIILISNLANNIASAEPQWIMDIMSQLADWSTLPITPERVFKLIRLQEILSDEDLLDMRQEVEMLLEEKNKPYGPCLDHLKYPNGQAYAHWNSAYYPNGQVIREFPYYYYPNGSKLTEGENYYYPNGSLLRDGSHFYDSNGLKMTRMLMIDWPFELTKPKKPFGFINGKKKVSRCEITSTPTSDGWVCKIKYYDLFEPNNNKKMVINAKTLAEVDDWCIKTFF